MARWAYRDLVEHFLDKENGGLYWTVTADGRPLDTRKQTYGLVFGIYGLAEYYRATGDAAALDQAIAIYHAVEQHARDPQNGGYFEAFSRAWMRLGDSAPFLVGPNTGKSQNTHIHILEAYTNLLRAWPDPGLRQSQRDLLDLVLTRIINPSSHHLVLFLRDDWTPVSTKVSYGHDIELSWLIGEAAETLGDPALVSRTRAISLQMAETTLKQGVESDGGIFNEGDASGRVTDAAKEWWPQAEAVTGFLYAYQISHDPRFFAAALRTWNFVQDKFIDRRYGDWYSSLDADNAARPRPKLTTWKCPYHNSRCCLQVIERLDELSRSQE
jgi:mannobiose 2-epimerase